MPEIQFDNQTVSYTITRSSRAKRISLKIDAAHGLQVIMPSRAKADVTEILREKQQWIQKHLQRYGSPRRYITGDSLPVYGVDHQLEVVDSADSARVSVSKKEQILLVKLPVQLSYESRRETVRLALESWYKREAKQYLPPEIARLAQKFGFRYQNITIRGQKTRWGSCSSQGNLNFNWRLVMTPPDAIEYVIIHELCHLKVPDHSARFWQLVAHYSPNYQEYVELLRVRANDFNLL